MDEIFAALWKLIRKFFEFMIWSFKGFPGTWPYTVISLVCIFFIGFGLFMVWGVISLMVDNIRQSFKDAKKKRIERKEEKEFEERQRQKTPQQKFEEAVDYYNKCSSSYDYEHIYYQFKSMRDQIAEAGDYAEKSIYGWYRAVARDSSDFIKNRNRSSMDGRILHSKLQTIMHEVAEEGYSSAARWVSDLMKTAEELGQYTNAAIAKETAEDIRDRMDEAAAMARELEELGYGDTSSSAEAYDRVDLSALPDMLFFTGDPDTVYQHYGYMTGGLGQRVRVYQSLDGDRQVSISWASTGFYNDGRTFSTDQGTVERYRF